MSVDLQPSSRPPVLEFFEGLFSEGHVRLVTPEIPHPDEIAQATYFVLSLESSCRDDCPGHPPAADRTATDWAVRMFYRASQLLVYRELGEEFIERDLSLPQPDPARAENIWSVDLVFRFLPDLWRIARVASESDPLVRKLETWGTDWPLSSVGMKLEVLDQLTGILAHPAMFNLLVDRLIKRQACGLLQSSPVRERVKALLDSCPQLAPDLVRAIREIDTRTSGEAAKSEQHKNPPEKAQPTDHHGVQ